MTVVEREKGERANHVIKKHVYDGESIIASHKERSHVHIGLNRIEERILKKRVLE